MGACVALILFFASVTWIRALNWGNPLLFAVSEAQMNPHSPRAAYELARNYMDLVQTQDRADSHLVAEAHKTMQHAATMPGANILPNQGLLLLSAHLHRETPEGTWARIQQALATQPLSVQNVEALNKLNSCVLRAGCDFPANEMAQSFLSAQQQTPPDTRDLAIYASYAFNVLHHSTLALNLARDAVKEKPTDLQVRANMLVLLAASGQREQAEAFYAQTLQDLPQARVNAKFRALLHTPSPAK